MDYLEIRLNAGNWDSALSLTWLVQIVLSEILGVPTTVEGGGPSERRSFYNPEGAIDYNGSHDQAFVANSANHKGCNCQLAGEDPCAHFIGESWDNEVSVFQQMIHDGKIEAPLGMGLLGVQSWMITKFTTQKDPTLAVYHGLVGEENRHKLAETFQRPTTWKDYCELISITNCTVPDDVAQRPPKDEEEDERMFFPGQYIGHFRATDANNCTLNPTTCTGHAANYPCGWTSYMEASIYHLDIGLECNGPDGQPMPYSYQQLIDMWEAANATRSNLLMMWWTPDQLYSRFFDTDAEMQRVLLKPVTQACVDNRPIDDCSDNNTERVGVTEGACDNPPTPLQKIISGCLFEAINSPSIPQALRSPAYETLKRFQLTDAQLGEIFSFWNSKETPRQAVCAWASQNLNFLKSKVPSSYPRVIVEAEYSSFGYFLIAFGSLAAILVVVTIVLVQHKQHDAVIRFAQVSFLRLILLGSILVAIGAILTSVAPTNEICVAAVWFVNMGYTLVLVPMCIKVAAINQITHAASKLRRVVIPKETLFGAVTIISFFCAVYLIFWTIFDPLQKKGHYTMTETTTDTGDHIVEVTPFCSGNSDAWQYAAVGWNAVLLLCASVLAFQNRNTMQAFNESRTLALLTYSNFMFVVLRCTTFLLSGQLNGAMLDQIRSLIYSADTMATLLIYFVPKFLATPTAADLRTMMSSRNATDDAGRVKISGLEPPRINGLEPEKVIQGPAMSQAPNANFTETREGSESHQNNDCELSKGGSVGSHPYSGGGHETITCPACGNKLKRG